MITYLAIPYSWNPKKSFEIANKVAAKLMKNENIIFSPISHSHPISEYVSESMSNNQKFWMNQDLPLLDICDEVCFVVIGKNGYNLLKESKGCMEELERAKIKNKKIKYFVFDEK